jgi:carboxypeptidase C (cathepsin A)
MSRSNHAACLTVLVALTACTTLAAAPDAPKSPEHGPDAEVDRTDGHHFEPFKAESVTTSSSVTIGGHAIAYQAVAGTLIVHPKGWDDVPHDPDRAIDLNGVILLSQILSFDLSPDRPTSNPGVDLPYETVLPTYAATAWYHHKLPAEHGSLDALLTEVEQFAKGDYARALATGSELTAEQRAAVAERLHQYTGLPLDYILRADLRIDGGEFRQNLQSDGELTTGRLDTRFSGPDLDPLSQRADYDPQAAALSSAYVTAFNEYARKELRYGEGKAFRPSAQLFRTWNFSHQPPGQTQPFSARQGTNVMPDLANAMKLNPNLKVQLHAGYFDLATPFYQGIYEMHHLPIPQNLQGNIEYCFYESGHMVYAKDASLRQMHDNVAGFIRRTGRTAQ